MLLEKNWYGKLGERSLKKRKKTKFGKVNAEIIWCTI